MISRKKRSNYRIGKEHLAGFLLLLFGSIYISDCQTSTSVPVQWEMQVTSSAPPAVILMIGDGMGLSQMSAAMYTSSTPLAIEQFPVIGFHKSHSSSDLITDSAAGATAFACGVKTYNGAIGLDADTIPCITIMEEAMARGLATGIVATSTIVHATPASFLAHERMRIFYEQIAEDICQSGVDIMIGGGKRYFDRRKVDDRDLLAELQTRGYLVADYFNGQLTDVRPDPKQKFAFLTADNQPLPVNQGRTYLTYASRLSADFLNIRGAEKGFVLMIEGSQIDWANHANEGKLAIQETLDFDRAIGEILKFAQQRGNTLVVVTADHESGGMALQNGSRRGKIETAFTTNGHTGTMIPVYAFGPGSETFSGIYENTAIYQKMRDFLRWGPNKIGSKAQNTLDNELLPEK